MKYLSLFTYELSELPESIGNLHQLKFLQLSETKITRFPNSFFSLPHLEMLNLNGCAIQFIPKELLLMPNLKYLALLADFDGEGNSEDVQTWAKIYSVKLTLNADDFAYFGWPDYYYDLKFDIDYEYDD